MQRTQSTMSKLTPEDVAWLEQKLTSVIEPVTPRPEFIHRARQELMNLPPERPMPGWVKPGVLAAVVLSLLALVATLFFLHDRE
jgi:hypothetical protein